MATAAAPASSTSLPLYRLDVKAYNQLVETGALEDEPVELLDGLLVEMSPPGADHMAVLRRLVRHFARAHGWLQVQDRLVIAPSDSPQPDIALLADEPPSGQLPRTALLVVEVAVTSHNRDRNLKTRVYARADVPIYWLLDVPARAVEVYTDPGTDGYGKCQTYGVGTRVPSPAAGVEELDVGWLFERVADAPGAR